MLKGQRKNPVPKMERDKLWCKRCKDFLKKGEFGTDGKTSSGNIKYKSRCKECYIKHSIENHTNPPSRLYFFVKELKRKCIVCNYDVCNAALEFHHIDPNKKDGSISEMVRKNVDFEVLKEEISKCVVVCNRCHREHHHGVIDLKEYF